MALNEWGFAAEIKSWWDAALGTENSQLDHCSVEDQVEVGGSQKRSDLTVLTMGGDVKLAGELRLPDHLQHDPWDPHNLQGAIDKAQARGANWAFTSDANTLLVIDCSMTGPVQDRVVQILSLGTWSDRKAMDNAAARAANEKAWVTALITHVIPLITGAAVPVPIAADERFIQSLRGLLQRPVRAIADALDQRRQSDAVFKADLITATSAMRGRPLFAAKRPPSSIAHDRPVQAKAGATISVGSAVTLHGKGEGQPGNASRRRGHPSHLGIAHPRVSGDAHRLWQCKLTAGPVERVDRVLRRLRPVLPP